MGLAASQARLLTLTSRQQAVEGTAQRLLSEKIRLSNKSDAAYQKYMNALEDTTLKTLQINNMGEKNWLAGNINNLMRLEAPEDTSGTPFFVQDLTSGKLYVPQDIADKYDDYLNLSANTIPTGHSYTEAMKFATLYGVEYKKVDLNEDIKKAYDNAIKDGWDIALTDEQYNKYVSEQAKDKHVQSISGTLLNMVNCFNEEEGYYNISSKQNSISANFEVYTLELLNSDIFKDLMTTKNVAGNTYATNTELIEKALNILQTFDPQVPKDIMVDATGAELDPTSEDYYYNLTYKTTGLSAKVGENELVNYTDGTREFSSADKFELMLNGGQTTWKGTSTLELGSQYWPAFEGLEVYKDKEMTDIVTDVYDSQSTTLIGKYNGATNFGDALNMLFKELNETKDFSNKYLSSIGKSTDDVVKYDKFRGIKAEYELYQPVYQYVPNNRIQSAYYENLFNAISAAGGCIGVNEGTAKNDTWVSNMIKNGSVILATWDSEEELLSRTSAALHTDVQEIADDRKVEQAEQEYEASMAVINSKDLNYDTRLELLETERTALVTEIDSIKGVMNDNVKNYFRVFS